MSVPTTTSKPTDAGNSIFRLPGIGNSNRLDPAPEAVDHEAWFFGIFTVAFWPQRTMRRCQSCAMGAIGAAHAIALGILLVIVIVGGMLVVSASFWQGAHARADIVSHTLREVTWVVGRGITERPLVGLGGLALLEAALLLLAALITPLVAQDEPLRSTFRHAVKTVWLWTGSWIPSLILLYGLSLTFRASWQTWRAVWGHPGGEFFRHVMVSGSSTPWYLRGDDEVLGAAVLLLAVWSLIVLVRAAATPRVATPRARPRCCEDCGYNLTGLPADGRCPECGVPTNAWIGSQSRRPTAWEQGEGLQPLWVLLRCSYRAACHPDRFFRIMPTRTGAGQARAALTIWFVLSLLLSQLIVASIAMCVELRLEDVTYLMFAAPVVAVIVLLYVLLLMAVVGFRCRLQWGLNVMPGVAKVFCYTYGMLVFLMSICVLIWGPSIWALSLAASSGYASVVDKTSLLLFGLWLVFFATCLAVHLYVSMIGVRRIRYANA